MPQVVPAAAAAFTAVGAAAAASPLLAAALQIGAGLVLSAAARALAPRPTSAAQTVSVRQPVVPRDLVYGRVRKGGVLIFAHRTRNSGSDYLHLIYALAGHQISAIERVYFDGREAIDVTTNTIYPRFTDSLQYAVRLGTVDQTAITNPFLPASMWTPAHRCRGVALLYLRLRGEADDYPNGIPNVTAIVRGKNDIYDPRDGQRKYTTNAALCLADYMAGALRLGYGVEGGLDSASLIAAANVCDEFIPFVTTGGEFRYEVGGVLSTAATPKENIEALLTACGGKAIYAGGYWRIKAAAYEVPTVALGPGDMRSISVQTRRALADNFNAVRGQFVSPENDWQPDDFPAFRSATYLAEDQGIESWRDLALPLTTSPYTAQRLAKIELERARRQQIVQVEGMLSAWRTQVGDTVTLTYPRWGWNAKPFEVRKVNLSIRDGALLPDLTLAEVSPLQYDWAATEAQIYAAAPRTDLPDPFDIAPPGVPQFSEELYETLTGIKTRLKITWPPSAGPFVSFYEVQVRQTELADGTATGAAFTTFIRTSLTECTREDTGQGKWEVRVQAVSTLGRRSDWATATVLVLGLDSPPAALTNVTIQSAGGTAILKWALPADLDVRNGGRIVIRHSALGVPTWQNSVSYDEVAGNQTIAGVPLKPGAYLLRAVDAGGLEGPVSIVSTKGIQAVPFANVTSLVAHPTWSGTKSNVEVNGFDQLTLTDPASPGVYTFATTMDLVTVQAVRLRSVIEATGTDPALLFDDFPGNFDDAPGDFDNPTGILIDVVVEGRFTDDNPAGSPTWTDWTRIDSNEIAFRAAQFRATLSVASAGGNVLLSELSVTADEVA